jgi:ATP-dependent Lhr-like helicase
VRVETRSGDTPQSERRRFFIRPPSILALTPESLAILLLNPRGRQVLSGVKYLIIDEIHALLGNKRGAFLSCQIDRLALTAGEFQRISLSATVRNPQIAAEFAGGTGRKVHIVAPASEKQIDFSVEYPNIEENGRRYAQISEDGLPVTRMESRYAPLTGYILRRIWEGATLLVFVESRRRAERLCYFLNTEAAALFARNGSPAGRDFGGATEAAAATAIAFPHHGSLSKELRRGVEQALAEGRLSCVVATASLELGIDIGSIDEVVLAGSTGSVSQAMQRIGRSGHGVGQVSRGKLFAFHGMDLLQAAALKDAVDERDIEEIRPIENPLDILAQLILALCAEKERNIEELYELIRKFYTFRNLNYESYHRVVRMLAGLSSAKNGENSRLRDIKPRIWLDKIEGKIGALDATLSLLYSSGGVIANRGLYSLRLADGTKIGELDEEFVWERSIGDCFDFGARGWRIVKIGSEAVEVTPLEKRADFIPFWKSDTVFRSRNLTERLLATLDQYNKTSSVETHLTETVRNSLKEFLDSQSKAQNGLPLSDNKNIAVEIIERNELNRDFCSIVFHSFRGGEVNYPLSLALSVELSESAGLRVESFSNDNSILFLIPHLGYEEADSSSVEEKFCRALAALESGDKGGITRAERLFRNRLESSGVFGAAFREAAERSLLLPKASFGKRTPLWIMRQRSKRLFDAVANEDGFPVTAEAWRICLVDTFDMDGFRELLTAINSGSVTLSFFHSNIPSPFSKDLVRMETGSFVYEYDERKDLLSQDRAATLSDKVIEEAIGNASLRPVLKTVAVNDFVSRLRREIPGYAPEDALSLSEWVKERVAIPLDEWEILRTVMPENAVSEIDGVKIKTVARNGAITASVVHREWEESWQTEPLGLLGQWLRYEGPVSIERICAVFGVSAGKAEDAVSALVEIEEAVNDVQITQDAPPPHTPLICDRENLEMLLRLSRKKERPVIKERPVSTLVPFLALRQGLTHNTGADSAAFRKNLYMWVASAKLWETEILCARNSFYDPEKLNRELREGRIVWYGAGKERIGFCRPEDLDLVLEPQKGGQGEGMARLLASPFLNRPRDFWEIKNELAIDSRACAETLWREVWQGALTADSFDPVRRGVEYGFVPKEIDIPQATEPIRPFGRQPRIPSALKNRWRSGAPVHGNWFSLLMEEDFAGISGAGISNAGISGAGGNDPITEDALNRERIRLLLDRWGVLCRPLLEHEAPVFSWSKLLPAMRRMELAGELTAGRFFAGINSLQFASPSIAVELEQAESFGGVYWMNAQDPASPAGLEIKGLEYPLCARSANNRLYYRDASLIAISAKNGKELQIFIEANDADMAQLIALLKIPRTRAVLPEKKLTVEKTNGQEAAKSDYAACFKEHGFESDRGRLFCW